MSAVSGSSTGIAVRAKKARPLSNRYLPTAQALPLNADFGTFRWQLG